MKPEPLYIPDTLSRVTADEAANLFAYHLALAIAYWEVGADATEAIDRAAKKLTHDTFRRALFALIPILDYIWKETEI